MKNSFVEFVTLFWLRPTVPLRLKEKICTVNFFQDYRQNVLAV